MKFATGSPGSRRELNVLIAKMWRRAGCWRFHLLRTGKLDQLASP